MSARESVRAATEPSVAHFVYVSVAPSASLMRAYVGVRMRGEALVREFIGASSVRSATFLRPWYVVGPGHRWPYALIPLYWLMEAIPRTRDRAREFGLVTIEQMVDAIVRSVEAPPASEGLRERILAVPDIRRADVTR